MNYVSLIGLLQNPLAGIAVVAFVVFLAGIILMRLSKGKEDWIDTASVLQGGGGSVFLGIVITAFMASHNMIS